MSDGAAVRLAGGPGELKACCAAAYEQDWVAALLGDSYHPGGAATTRRLAGALELAPGMRVLDVACGTGTTALLLAAEYGVEVVGIDRSPALARKAADRAVAAGLPARFLAGDGEVLPVSGGAFDAVVCECALCTFPDQAAGAREMARVLRPGGRVGLSDVTVDRSRLPFDVGGLAGWAACLGGARQAADYRALLSAARLETGIVEDLPEAMTALLDQIEPRLLALSVLRLDSLPALDAGEVKRWMAAAREAVEAGSAGYCLVTARRPAAGPAGY